MVKTIIAIFVILAGLWIYASCLPPPTPEELHTMKDKNDRAVESELTEVCIKGVVYYSTDDSNYIRFTPAVDAGTLQFKRCP